MPSGGFLLDRAHFTIVDNWAPLDLRGTGSNRIVVAGATIAAE